MGLLFLSASQQETASGGRHSLRRSKLGAHTFKYKHETGKVNWKCGDIISMHVPSEDLPPARLHHLNLLKQQHQLGTRHPKACAQIPVGAFLILIATVSEPRMKLSPFPSNCHATTDVHSTALRCHSAITVLPQHARACSASLYFLFLIVFWPKASK